MIRRVLACTFIFIAAATTHSASSSGSSALLGVTYGNQGWDLPQLQALESWAGRRNAVVMLFTTWDTSSKVQKNLFTMQLPAIWNNKNIPLISWQPFSGGNTPSNIVHQIAGGAYDGYLQQWVTGLRGFLSGPDNVLHTADDRRAYIRLAHEMNGNWYPWGQVTPGDYIAMWIRARAAFASQGLDANVVQWVWSVNNVDSGPWLAEYYYPGDAWVDWIAVDGYNWGESKAWSDWQTPDQVLGPMVSRLRAVTTKPLALTETGSTSISATGTNVALKNTWVSQLYAWALGADIKMICWFNMNTDSDFTIFGGRTGNTSTKVGRTTYKAYSAYREAVSSGSLVPSTPSNPRLLTDAQFRGI